MQGPDNQNPKEVLIDLIGGVAAEELVQVQDRISHIPLNHSFLGYATSDTWRLHEAIAKYIAVLYHPRETKLIIWNNLDEFRAELTKPDDGSLLVFVFPETMPDTVEHYAAALQSTRDWITRGHRKVLLVMTVPQYQEISRKAPDYFSVNTFVWNVRDQKALYDMSMPPLAEPHEDADLLQAYEDAGAEYDQTLDEELPTSLQRKAWLRFIEAAKKLERWPEVKMEAEKLAEQAAEEGDRAMEIAALLLLCEAEAEVGHFKKAMELVTKLKAFPSEDLGKDGEMLMLWTVGRILYSLDQYEPAFIILKRVADLAGELEDKGNIAVTVDMQAAILLSRGQVVEALTNYKIVESIARELGSRKLLAGALGNQALILRDWGRLDEAMALHKEEERLDREIGNKTKLATGLGNQAVILQLSGRLEEALALHREEETICRELGAKKELAISLGNQAIVFRSLGQLEKAMSLLKEKESIIRELGDKVILAVNLGQQAIILSDWGRLDEAMTQHIEVEKLFRELSHKAGLATCLGNQSLILQEWGHLDQSMLLHKEEETLFRELGNNAGLAYSLGNQAAILEEWNRHDEAIALVTEAMKLAQGIDAALEAFLKRRYEQLLAKHNQAQAAKQ